MTVQSAVSFVPVSVGAETIGIPLTKGRVALIDAADAAIVDGFAWVFTRNGYARAFFATSEPILMHRLIMAAKPGQIIDHVNRDRLDNRRKNLRFCSPTQSQANRARLTYPDERFRGVEYDTRRMTYRAAVFVGGVRYRAVRRKCPVEAARDYDALAIAHHGKFACLNFPELVEGGGI